MSQPYNVQFSGITAHFSSVADAAQFCDIYRAQTGAILGIQRNEPRARKAPAAVDLPERADLDRAFLARELSKDDYFAACKRIGLRDDLRFLLRVTGSRMPEALRVEAGALLAELETRAGKPADAKAINSLRDRYRMSLGSLIVYKTDDAVAEVAQCRASIRQRPILLTSAFTASRRHALQRYATPTLAMAPIIAGTATPTMQNIHHTSMSSIGATPARNYWWNAITTLAG